MLNIHQIPALSDNFIYFLRDEETGRVAVVDPSAAAPVLEVLARKGWQLSYVLSTHHHWDHVGGNVDLKNATGCKVIGYEGDKERIPGIDIALKENEIFALGNEPAKVIAIPGHTLGHIAYWFSDSKAVFVGDTLFSIGCGRLFEGTPGQMFESLGKLKQLPDDTRVYCGHEYTLANLEFALTLEPESKALLEKQKRAAELRRAGRFTVPSLLKEEKELNPFLKARTEAEFAELRRAKDDY